MTQLQNRRAISPPSIVLPEEGGLNSPPILLRRVVMLTGLARDVTSLGMRSLVSTHPENRHPL
jgi:hypothetical protein